MQASAPSVPIGPARSGGPTDPSHDELLRRGIIHTQITRPVAYVLSVLFLLGISGVPLSQAYLEKRAEDESSLADLFRRAPTADNLRLFEKGIEDASYAKSFTQPRLQLALSRFGREGNKKAVIGRNGWLYYAPGVLHVAGPGFLQEAIQQSREKQALDAGDEPLHADPRPAIFAFQKALAQRGIRLVLFPMPDKAALAPEPLTGRPRPRERLQNVDFAAFVRELRAAGVAVFDAYDVAEKHRESALFLVQDTHYAPAFMEQIAVDLGSFVARSVSLAPAAATSLHSVAQPVERLGDIVDMLKLPDDQKQFLPQSVVVHQVQGADGTPWEPDPKAEVLLLGDSFSNVFSLEGMGWGDAAGLGPQLSLALNRPVDVIAQNDSGAFATRRALQRELSAGVDRLAGKRVVIWEFASRELSVGDWKPLEWPEPMPPAQIK